MFGVSGLVFGVEILVSGPARVHVLGVGSGVWGLRRGVWGLEFGVWGLGFGVSDLVCGGSGGVGQTELDALLVEGVDVPQEPLERYLRTRTRFYFTEFMN